MPDTSEGTCLDTVSNTDLGSFGEINARKCAVRLLHLVKGEVGRGCFGLLVKNKR